MRRLMVGTIALATLCLPLAALAAEHHQKPSGTIELKGGSVAVGVGFSWGSGTLHFHGKSYPISADGFDVGDVGVSNIAASGTVYNLKNLADFDGNYTSAAAGAAVAGGGSVLTMANQNGVKINLKSTTRGVKLTLGVGGVKLAVKK